MSCSKNDDLPECFDDNERLSYIYSNRMSKWRPSTGSISAIIVKDSVGNRYAVSVSPEFTPNGTSSVLDEINITCPNDTSRKGLVKTVYSAEIVRLVADSDLQTRLGLKGFEMQIEPDSLETATKVLRDPKVSIYELIALPGSEDERGKELFSVEIEQDGCNLELENDNTTFHAEIVLLGQTYFNVLESDVSDYKPRIYYTCEGGLLAIKDINDQILIFDKFM